MSLTPAGPVTGDRTSLATRFARAWSELTGRDRTAMIPGAAPLQTRAGAVPLGRPQRRNSYRGGEVSRLLADWVSWPTAPDLEMRGDMRLLRGRARELSRNNAHIRQYLNLLKANVLGPKGLDLQPQIRDERGELVEEINDLIEDHWERWACGPVTADGRMPLNELAQLALETTARDGEAFTRFIEHDALNPYGLSLQMYDADLVDDSLNRYPGGRTPEVRLGIEIDEWGRRLGYHIREQQGYNPGQGGLQQLTYRIPASEMLHLFRPARPNQTRGVTWFAAAMLPLQHLQGYTEAELIAARTAAAKMGFVVTKDPSAASAPLDNEDGSGTGVRPVEMEANPGSIEELDPGQEFQSWDPTHPSTAFGDFTKAVLREIATALGVSYNALANDLEGVNYSSMRSGMLIERDLWKMLQQWWGHSFMQPVYERWLNTAILSRAIPLPHSDWRMYTDVRWNHRGWAWVDPKNDAEAGALAISLGLTSRKRLLAETGADFREIIEEIEAETKFAAEKNVTITGAAPPAAGPDARAAATHERPRTDDEPDKPDAADADDDDAAND